MIVAIRIAGLRWNSPFVTSSQFRYVNALSRVADALLSSLKTLSPLTQMTAKACRLLDSNTKGAERQS